jgi:hypothetical protein
LSRQHWPQPSHRDSHSSCDIAVSDLTSQNGVASCGCAWGLPLSRGPRFARFDLPTCYPRPSNGILVALMFMNSTLVSSGKLAM